MSGLRHLLPWIVCVGMVVVLQFRPIHDTDIFWQRKLGSLLLAERMPTLPEPFTSTHANEAMPAIAWLGQIVIATVSNWAMLHYLDAVMFAGAFLLAGVASRHAATPERIAFAMALGFIAALPHHSLRPQTFGIVTFAGLLCLLEVKWRWPWRILAITALLILWQNLHPSASIGVGLIALRAGLALTRADTRKEWLGWLGLLLLAGATLLATPTGFGLFAVSAYNAEMSRELGIAEWLPLYHPRGWPASGSGWVVVLITSYLLIRERRQVRREDLAIFLAFTVLMLGASRFVVFWGLVLVPVMSRSLSGTNGSTGTTPMTSQERVRSRAGLFLMIGFLGLVPLVRTRLFIDYIPFAGITTMKETGITGTIYCYPGWGGPLIDAGWPTWKVTRDGRYYLYSREEWQAFLREAAGDVSLAEIEHTYAPAAFFVHPVAQAGLVRLLEASSEWQRIHLDGSVAVFIRK